MKNWRLELIFLIMDKTWWFSLIKYILGIQTRYGAMKTNSTKVFADWRSVFTEEVSVQNITKIQELVSQSQKGAQKTWLLFKIIANKTAWRNLDNEGEIGSVIRWNTLRFVCSRSRSSRATWYVSLSKPGTYIQTSSILLQKTEKSYSNETGPKENYRGLFDRDYVWN